MGDYKVELGLYHDCLYEIKRRIGVIADHLNKKTTERYLIIEVETICLQFRKILEKIMLMSLVANKEAYAEQNAKFAKHYHAERIMRDLERINPDFYPVPTMLIHKENPYSAFVAYLDGQLKISSEIFEVSDEDMLETLGTVRINYPEIFVDGESE